ncbi:NAD(P)H-dependent flavin oxidoreductase [Acinetobacter larvae]|uniref:Nitronate monooxygenase n=1 Tax=Acinetobacter larvae TaxID=1789224 RepID=A0A1B2M0R4_9GAMM|nr:nitronate monooxygenase [Acinetobacter larvae]AOA58768.1 2-nitropropane dioxygenase [Acinetobacter larvae]
MHLLQQLDIKHPILLAPMAGVSTATLAAEVSNQGALGALGLGASTPAQARQQILDTQHLTSAPFQVNFFCHQSPTLDSAAHQAWIAALAPLFAQYGATPPSTLNCIYPSFLDHDDYLDVVLALAPKAVSFHFGIPHAAQIAALKHAGIVTMVSATNLAEAQLIEQAGIDVIIAQGIEAGGHRGIFNIDIDAALSTADLVKLCVAECQLPVVAAGGIMNGQQAKHMLKLGASAVQLGTAFVACPSSAAHAAYRYALKNNPHTHITRSISGRPARSLMQHWQTRVDRPDRAAVAAYPYAYDLAKQLHAAAAAQDDHGYGAFWAGANVAQIRPLAAPDLINQLVLEMNQTA